MGAPRGNKNAAGPHGGTKRGRKTKKFKSNKAEKLYTARGPKRKIKWSYSGMKK